MCRRSVRLQPDPGVRLSPEVTCVENVAQAFRPARARVGRAEARRHLGGPVVNDDQRNWIPGQDTGAGSVDSPIRYRSTPRAALRPSAIAQTISDCPRCMSPVAKTPGTLVIQSAVAAHRSPRCHRHTEVGDEPRLLGAGESHGEEDEIGREVEFRARHRLEGHAPVLASLRDAGRFELAHAAVLVADEPRRGHRVDTLAAFLVRGRHAEDLRPLRPWVVGGARVGRAGQDLELMHRSGALAMHRAEAVGAGVAAADDHDMLAGRGDEVVIRNHVAFAAAVLERQELHREMDALQIASRNRQVTCHRDTARQHHGVELRAQTVGADGPSGILAGAEHDALLLHDAEPAIEHGLLHLELGDAVAQQPADAIGPLEDRDEVSRLVQLIGRRQPRGSRSDDRHRLAGAQRRRGRGDPSFLDRALDDRQLDRLDRDRVVVDAQHARSLARRRTEAAGELGKVVGGEQAPDRGLPAVAIDEIVPVGDQVAERAALVTEGNAAVHAACALLLERCLRVEHIDLAPVAHSFGDGPRRLLGTCELDESGRFTHRKATGYGLQATSGYGLQAALERLFP